MTRNQRPGTFLLAASLGGAALATGPLAAANLLLNGSFDTSTAGWTTAGGVSWAEGGTARLEGTPGVVGAVALAQCVAVAAGAEYDLSASVLLPSSPDAAGGLSLRVVWHEAPGCSSVPIGVSRSVEFPSAPPVWRHAEATRLRAPAGAVSASAVVIRYGEGTGAAFTALVDDVALAPSPRFVVLTVPTAASVDGARGERFRTTLVVRNPSLAPRRIDFQLRCREDEACLTAVVSLLFGPRETRIFGDALLDLFGRASGAGAIEVAYDAALGPVTASARAATVHAEQPGNGMALPVLPPSAARSSATFLGLSDGRAGEGGTRVNAGAYNPNDEPVVVSFRVRDETGRPLGRVVRSFAPREWFQVDDVFAQAGEGPARPGSSVTVDAEGPVFPFVISVDNRSGDPDFLEPMEVPAP